MAWWTIDKQDNVMSDGVADEVARMLGGIVKARRAAGREPPALRELLDAIERALRDGVGRVEAPGPGDRHLHIPDVPGVRSDAGAADPELAAAVGRGLDRLAAEWQQAWKRPPRLRELLHAISFVLCAAPAEYVREAPSRDLDDIEAA